MKTIYDFILHIYNTLPPPVAVMLVGWAMSISMTQPLKFLMPLKWRADDREIVAQLVAFLSGFGTVMYLMPTAMGFFLGTVIGIWSPLAFFILMLMIEKRWPKVKDFMSGDIRGTLIGQRRENK